ncbi:hypothetical protein GGTG_12555 [Gaeumannomyces tritici R3-111a-1]|uniref:Putative gamma-glutamylcyclotransferase n=2 Tax=Gaeumannomyces tritici (strain R3-111a-1) TaxID=644352 RepID=J3PGD0_GAET3|nr:hypothetical protein GGTG_12555 [Gaeumannomyces tritici R3-111a-1]EJT69672.1 hypothetical protein GGTG_12555 [Gaeumannomyces tritici R3-111a-1]
MAETRVDLSVAQTNMGDNTAESGNSAAGQESYSAFFYGTLMAPEVFFTVCFRLSNPPAEVRDKYRFRPAVLPGYCRHRVQHADYPGVVADAATPGREVRGAFVDGLTAENVAKLDYFEGSEYTRRTVRVRLLDVDDGSGGAEVETQTYVYRFKDNLDDEEWDFDEFRRDKLRQWVREDYVFADCDPDHPATVATEDGDEAKQS